MTVDLGDLVEPLRREINPPGVNLYPDATDDRLLGDVLDAFWTAVLQGAISGYKANDDGIVTPINGTTDLPRDVQQIIVLYAGYRIALTNVQNTNSSFRAVAGPVSFEQQKSAQAMTMVLKSLQERLAVALLRVRSTGIVSTAVFDAVIQQSVNDTYGPSYWVR